MHDVAIFGINGNFGQYFAKNVLANRSILGIDAHTSYARHDLSNVNTILFCTPYSVTRKLVCDISDAVRPHQTIIDICSVKSGLYTLPTLAAQNIVSLHPLYSPNVPNERNECIACAVRGVIDDAAFVEHFSLHEMTVREHDEQMAVVQAAVHFQNFVTAHFLKQHAVRTTTQLYTTLEPVLRRQLAQNPHMMAEIQVYNPYVRPALAALKESFDTFFRAVDGQNIAEVVQFIEQAR